jgi:regulator of sigma E protease
MWSIIIFLLVLVALIIAHEFGHFVVAKLFKIRVDEFGIFFPPRLFGWKRGETVYTLNALPFGGFVKIFGETSDEDPGAATDPRSFINKNRGIQAAVILAGIFMNLALAWLALSAAYMIGMQSPVEHIGVGSVQNPHITITAVLPNSPAAKAGMVPGDVIASIEAGTGQLAQGASSDEATRFIGSHQDESLILNIERGQEKLNLLTKPVDGLVPGKKVIGIEMDDIGTLRLSPPLALVQGAIFGEEITVETVKGLGGLVGSLLHGHADLSEVAGPVGIVSIGKQAVEQGVVDTILLTSLISINLAIFNLLPIPGLDGGRLLFIIIEAIRRKPLSNQLMLRLTVAGFALIILLALAVTYHDVLRLIHPAA